MVTELFIIPLNVAGLFTTSLFLLIEYYCMQFYVRLKAVHPPALCNVGLVSRTSYSFLHYTLCLDFITLNYVHIWNHLNLSFSPP